MLDLLDWNTGSQIQSQVRTLVERGDLAGATAIIEEFVAQSQDRAVVQAARTSAADHRLAELGETGCHPGSYRTGLPTGEPTQDL
jgi:hypothetical protein